MRVWMRGGCKGCSGRFSFFSYLLSLHEADRLDQSEAEGESETERERERKR
jgi:hypothetical protein